jgi:CHAT domain-containing protein/exonuclease VII small subunit
VKTARRTRICRDVRQLAEAIKRKGQTSTKELPALLKAAEQLARDESQDVLTRALAHRAAGNANQLLNQFQPALDSYNAAAALLDTIDEPVELGRTLHAKVGMLFTLSRFDELFTCAVRARELFERCQDRTRLARLDVNLAHAYHRLGRHKEALECSERAVHILQHTDDAEGVIAAAINSAVTLTAMHEFDRAEDRYRLAMNLAAERTMSRWILLSRFNLAYLRYLNGDTAAALDELEAVRHEYERSSEEWMTCHVWLAEAEILLEIGDLDDAIAAARRARSLSRKLGLNSETARSLLYEAAAAMRIEANAEAGAMLEEAAQRFADEGDQVSSAVAKLQTALLRADHGDLTALADAVSARHRLAGSGLPHRRALAEIAVGRIQRAGADLDAAVESFKAALALAEGSRSEWMQFHAAYELGVALHQRADAQSIMMFKRADRLLDSLWHRLGSDDLKMTFLADRENVYTYLVRSAVAESPAAALEYAEKARSRVLREKLLSRDAAEPVTGLLPRLSSDETIIEYFISGNDLHIFALRHDALKSFVRPEAVGRLYGQWQQLERHIESCSVKWERLAGVRHHLQATAQHHLQRFYEELIEPVRAELRHRVVFVPHGFLHAVPLHSLHDGTQYLAERFCISYSPTASLYLSPAQLDEPDDPLFIAFSAGAESSIQEVEEAALRVHGAVVLVDPSIQRLRQAFAVPRSVVHIAGHAGIDAVSGRLSWIETPEGRLTSRDLAGMPIRAKTIVITGCRTARRLIQPGDEWLGLMRSFYLSGASNIVSAFWDIRDADARRFASEFYTVFNGNNAAVAVQSAAARLRQQQPHPYFWAGFGTFVRKFERD